MTDNTKKEKSVIANNSKGPMNNANSKGGSAHENKYNKNKRRKNTSRDNYGGTKSDTKDIGKSKPNDASWYALDEFLLRDSSSLSYSQASGQKVDVLQHDGVYAWIHDDSLKSVPGVCALRLKPSVGMSEDSASPINIASKNIYSFVRHANSGHSNYDSPDLMMYLMAMDSLYSAYSWLCRLYGMMNVYSQRNRNYPRSLIMANTVDYDDILIHLSDFRMFINTMGVKIGSMCVPNSMPLMIRHMWIYSGYYLDGNSSKAQIYMFVPHGFYKYNATKYNTGGCCEYKALPTISPTNYLKYADIVQMIQGMIDVVIADEDMNIMSGDILKAFGPDGIFKLSGINEDYTVLPEFNLEVLSQIQNATVFEPNVPITPTLDGWDIFQEDGYIRHYPILDGMPSNNYRGILDAKRMFTLYKDDVNPSDSMVASRLTVMVNEIEQDDYTVIIPKSCGSELCLGGYIVTNTWGPGGGATGLPQAFSFSGSMNVADFSLGTPAVLMLQVLEKFSYHPAVMIWQYSSSILHYYGYFFDVDNFTILSNDELDKMHTAALLSEFAVPQMGSFSRKLQK